jgi:hypothetical protein
VIKRHPLLLPGAAAVALVLLRSAVWTVWEQSDFDADQAIVGLMAKHLAELRAIPLYFYGQHYLLGVEAWIAAPFFLAFGVSVPVLKTPLVLMNVAIALLLLRCLVRDGTLRPWHAFAASLFFVLPPPAPASRLLASNGGNVEPLLYTLILWLTRARPVVFGLVAIVGLAHREYTLYALVAIVLLDLWEGRLLTRANIRDKAIALGVMALGAGLLALLKGHADLGGPGTAGTPGYAAVSAQFGTLASRFCWNPALLIPNLRWLVGENLSVIFGWHEGPLSTYAASGLRVGHAWAWLPIAVLIAAAAIGRVTTKSTLPAHRTGFAAYLILVGLQSALVYATLGCLVQDHMLIRYTLLTLFIPIGICAYALSGRPPKPVVWLSTCAVAVWAIAAGVDQTRVLEEYVRHPPPSHIRELANYLEGEGVKYGQAGYWTAYLIDFLTDERLLFSSFEKVRIVEYQRVLEEHDRESVIVSPNPPCGRTSIPFREFCISVLERARHAR